MRTSYSTYWSGDATYYDPSVSELLSYDAYSRSEFFDDDHADIHYFVSVGAPLRVAVAPDRSALASKGEYECDRCGRIMAGYIPSKTDLTCRDCQVVERKADPPPVESLAQRRLRLEPPTPADMTVIKEARIKRRKVIAEEQERTIREQQGALVKAYMVKVDAKKRAEAKAYEDALLKKVADREARLLRPVEVRKFAVLDAADAQTAKPTRRLKAPPKRRIKPHVEPLAPIEAAPAPAPESPRPQVKAGRKAEIAERKDKAQAERAARQTAKQSEAERLFLADLEASGATWLLSKNHA